MNNCKNENDDRACFSFWHTTAFAPFIQNSIERYIKWRIFFFRTILTHRSFPMLANLIAVKRWSYLVHIKNETWWQCTTCPNELPSLFCLPPPNIFYFLFLQWNLCQELYLWWSVRRRKGHDIPCHLKHQPSLPPFHQVPKIRTTAGVHLQETCL